MRAQAKNAAAGGLIVRVLRDKLGSEDMGGALDRMFLINDPAGTFSLTVQKWDDPTGPDQDEIGLSLTIGEYGGNDAAVTFALRGKDIKRIAELPAFVASAVSWIQACGLLLHTSPEQWRQHATVAG